MKGRSIFEMTEEEIQTEMRKAQRNVGILVALAFLGLGVYIIVLLATL